MRVAIIYSGFLRNFEENKSSHLNCLWNLSDKTDIFLHSWSILGDAPMDGPYKGIQTLPKLDNLFRNKLVRISIEPKKDMQAKVYEKYCTDRQPQRLVSMFYSTEKAFGLIDDNYDLYIRVRGDIRIEESLDPENIKKVIANKSLIGTPGFGHYFGLNDQFAYGSRKAMEAYCRVYSNLPALVEQSEFLPEKLLAKQMGNSGIAASIDNKLKYHILRGNGSIHSNNNYAVGGPELI